MDRGPIDRLAVLPNGQEVGDREGLAVADDHAVDRVVGHPGADPGVDAHLRQADLVLRSVVVFAGAGGQVLFVGAPAHFGRGDALLVQALDAPGVDELVDLLGPVGDLRVALAAMDDLDAQLLGQPVERPAV